MTEWFSPAGMIGAAIGLVIGWIDYRIVGAIVVTKLRATDKSTTAAEKADYERRIGLLQKGLFVMTVVAFPVVGYFLGLAIAGWAG
ncbi:MAG: hypothetical protein EA385_05715 [Salinarimonadaceae bacterium]|nr:MAG: hypothetical protein EA385_05715 [Salinarimonadaceae bacterium]